MSFNSENEEFRKLFPFQSNYFDLGGCRMHYVDEGQGDVILMIHSCPVWSFFFRNMIAELSKRYRVIAMDQIGFGLSDKPLDYDYRLETHIDNLERFIRQKKLKNMTMLMHGRGAAIGMAYAVRYPEDVKGFIVMNAMPFSDFVLPLRFRITRFLRIGISFAWKLSFMASDFRFLPKEVKNAYLQPLDNPGGQLALRRFAEDLPCHPEDDSAQSMYEIEGALWMLRDKPCSLIWSKNDWLYGERCLKKWKSYFPASDTRYLYRSGRYPAEEEPAELQRLMDEVLERQKGK